MPVTVAPKKNARLRNSTTQRQTRRRSDIEPNAVSSAISYAMHRSRSHNAVICVYDEAGNLIETHEQVGEFKEP